MALRVYECQRAQRALYAGSDPGGGGASRSSSSDLPVACHTSHAATGLGALRAIVTMSQAPFRVLSPHSPRSSIKNVPAREKSKTRTNGGGDENRRDCG